LIAGLTKASYTTFNADRNGPGCESGVAESVPRSEKDVKGDLMRKTLGILLLAMAIAVPVVIVSTYSTPALRKSARKWSSGWS
jgi:hypothetical protein